MGTIKADTLTGLADPNKVTLPSGQVTDTTFAMGATLSVGSTTATLNFGNTVIANGSAGSTTVTGEGGSTTTNLQQGLAKVWAKCDEHTIEDSLNVTSSTDHGTGDYTITIANDIARVEYSLTLASGATQNLITALAAGSYRRECSNSSGSAGDVNFANSTVHGDLA